MRAYSRVGTYLSEIIFRVGLIPGGLIYRRGVNRIIAIVGTVFDKGCCDCELTMMSRHCYACTMGDESS